jgi:5-amino-6-(5-phosphoribosylamino)uracil reductase/diaminohydroxyphosphoribosylaminopyrimidine deaminase/5-amino-6-(5-phosphoribosylamino)uracil reductase
VAVCVAPKLLGAGLEAVGDLGIRALAHMITLHNVQSEQYGVDWIVQGDVVYTQEQSDRDA